MRTFPAPNPSHLTPPCTIKRHQGMHSAEGGIIGRSFPHTLPIWPFGESHLPAGLYGSTWALFFAMDLARAYALFDHDLPKGLSLLAGVANRVVFECSLYFYADILVRFSFALYGALL